MSLEAALDYARQGWRVVPILPGSKRPALTRWTDLASTDPATIKEWWDGHDDYGVGIATGPASGFFVVDIDDVDAFADFEERNQKLPATRTSITGSGGYHLLYRWPDGADVRNDAGRRLGPGMDIRGDGGQIVAPPTVHPNGNAYEWDLGEPGDIADAPPWLLELLTATAAEPGQGERTANLRSDRPGDQWGAATTWGDILTRDGWQLHHIDRDGERHWTRPGKDTREGTSATTGYKGSDILKVFTSSMAAAGLDEEQTYTKLGYLAATRFDGDHTAAATFLASQGWGDTVDTDDLADLLAERTEQTLASVPDVVTKAGGDHWQFIDLGPILDGTYAPPVPTLLTRSDGVGLIYPDRVHSIAGEPGGGKTWLALHLIAVTLTAGGTAMMIDYEDSPDSAVSRLLSLGVPTDAIRHRFTYVRPDGPLIDRQGRPVQHTLARLEAVSADVVVIDSVGESLAAEGFKPNDDEAVANWFRLLPRRLARQGSAVVGVDHVAKDRDTRGMWAIGSQRKLAAIDGAAYVVDVRTAPTKDRDGHLRIMCAKDRHGTHQRGHQVATVDIVNGGPGVVVNIHPPEATTRPTTLMERVSRLLEEQGPASGRTIEAGVEGKAKFIRLAIDTLSTEGHIVAEKRGRDGNAWRSVTPFRAPDELAQMVGNPVDNPVNSRGASPASHPRPQEGDAPQNRGASPASPPYRERGDVGTRLGEFGTPLEPEVRPTDFDLPENQPDYDPTEF